MSCGITSLKRGSIKDAFRLRRLRGGEGFTLIELVVVVAILGILASIMIPQILGFAMKAKQSEAKELLATLYTVEEAFFGENNAYGTLSTAGFTPSSTPKYYTNIITNFTFTNATTGGTFTGTCSANLDSDSTMDVWEVTNLSRTASNTSDDVRN